MSHTHGGTDAPECTTCSEVRRGKHQGEWRRCVVCGKPENAHNVRHPFQPWRAERPVTP